MTKNVYIHFMKERLGKFWEVTVHFFPFQLLFWHVKNNHIVLFCWAALFGFVLGLGSKFGVPFLFVSPEYMGKVGFPSFLLLGFGFGGFIMSFNLYSYIILGPHFPFIATLSRPFSKFSTNNFILPFAFVLVFALKMFHFQMDEEFASFWDCCIYLFAFVLGVIVFSLFSFLYFFRTNKDFFKLTGQSEKDFIDKNIEKPIASSLHKRESWQRIFRRSKYKRNRRHYYLSHWIFIRKSRDWTHYDRTLLDKIFSQNHINASIFEIFTIGSFFFLSTLSNVQWFVIPAGASIMLIFSILLMLISAFYSWFKAWTYTIFILIFVMLNFFSTRVDFLSFKNFAYGIDYQASVDLTEENLKKLNSNLSICKKDKNDYIEILNNWKKQTKKEKPKLVIVNCSGGGSRSALWTFLVLRNLDSLSGGILTNHIQMITGASGGMIGASFFRELSLKIQENKIPSLYANKYMDEIGKDLLNKISFTIATNDLFFRYKYFKDGTAYYPKDRAYAFEEQLNENLEYFIDKRLGEYSLPEKQAKIPVMIFSPTVINTGRRLLISSQGLGFLQLERLNAPKKLDISMENIEFGKVFKFNNPMNIRFTSVLRMNATFPYILPMVTLPGDPSMEIMDAGIRDNYGTKTTMEFIGAFKDWIKDNTSGVVIIRIRDTKKNLPDETKERKASMLDKLLLPFGNIYGNFPRVQDFNQDELITLSVQHFGFPVDLFTFSLGKLNKKKISLSWHLTSQEKSIIFNAIRNKYNENEAKRVLQIIQ
jgi:predicted acylesterase/phospholipase RssA